MSSKIIPGMLVLFLLFPLIVYAEDIDITFYRNSYSPFETVQANIIINNITLSKGLDVSNFVFLRSDNSSINIAKNLVKVNNSFYVVYFDLPNLSAGNYDFGLANVNYIKENSFKIGRFLAKLQVTSEDKQILSIRPGYVFNKVVTNQESPFTLFIRNGGTNIITVYFQKEGDFFNFGPVHKINLAPSYSNTVDVKTSLFGKNMSVFNGVVKIIYDSKNYLIPFNIMRTDFTPIVENTTISNVTIPSKELNYSGLTLTTLSDKPISNLSVTINVEEYYPPGQIVLRNSAGAGLHNLRYILSGSVNSMFQIQPSSIDVLEDKESAVFLFGLNNSYDFFNGRYSGSLNFVSDEGVELNVPLDVSVFGIPLPTGKDSISIVNETNITKEVPQDVSVSSDEDKGFSVWLVILIIVIIFLLVIFYLYKKTKRKKEEFEGFVERVKMRQS
ncbi:hypothetical protein J4230_02800 [Candidatus Woesearchaeota archaeon]|nr:hypothetical protein [Candidatus Woesearchaeota archaeon]